MYDAGATWMDLRFGWDRLPVPLGLAVLVGLRDELRRHNLHDSNLFPSVDPAPLGPPPQDTTVRTADGSYDDLAAPRAGMAGARFGRNVPLDDVDPDPEATLLEPNPREVSRRLLTRTQFVPATTVNALVAAWLQFMIKDWFSHGHGDAQRAIEVPLEDGDDWPQDPMVVPRTTADPTRPAGATGAPTFVNALTHWWDLSSVYGADDETMRARRTGRGGHLRLDASGLVPLPADDPATDPTREPGFWVGLGMMASAFALEHNAICDHLASARPELDDDALFARARMVNAAVVAKIHTVEWTPAVIAHPTTEIAMRANWFGLAGERVHRLLGRISSSELLSGIPGSHARSYGVPYSLTEEFAAVYRMHPLMRDDYPLKDAESGAVLEQRSLPEMAGPASREVFATHPLPDLFYSFGTEHAGAIVLRNFPRGLQYFVRPNDGRLMDIAAIDILRTREAGVPRYNEFRRLLRMRPVRTFAELTDDAGLAAELDQVYGGDVERLDLTIGMFAERRPRGFAFSDTAFRIFILMASRRLDSDRFFTDDYTTDVYTEAGMRWIDDATMAGVLHRHWPSLERVLPREANAFKPWPGTATD
jgi:hypothetical protein